MDGKRIITILVCILTTVALTSACGNQSDGEPASTLSRAQRDSVLAASELPGASVVGRAIETADSANARAQRTDASAP